MMIIGMPNRSLYDPQKTSLHDLVYVESPATYGSNSGGLNRGCSTSLLAMLDCEDSQRNTEEEEMSQAELKELKELKGFKEEKDTLWVDRLTEWLVLDW